MSATFTIVVTYDDPDCGGAADALVANLDTEGKRLGPKVPLEVKPLAVTAGNSHREALYRAMQELFSRKLQDVFVVTFLKGSNAEEYRKVMELCETTKPPISRLIITNLSSFVDAGLTVRNVTKKVLSKVMNGGSAL
jgi:hypothetical protein